jgi:hypothetical protein
MAGCAGGKKKGYKEGGKVFSGISKDTEKAIEDALSEAMSDPKKNPTSKYHTLKGRNNTMKRKPRSEIARFKDGGKVFPDLNNDGEVTRADILKGRGVEGFYRGGDVRANPNRGKCY